MDPLTIVATVASIAQLAQVALALSKTLYNVGSTIASASDDIKILADDLKTFSQSLSLLSRLLEDSKAWYSDDVYLLTAKIIRDCADLYVKIDKILVKLGGNGKSNWKFRVKFVYKEGQIKKLMTRLRDMKGTLATILMSLQVDLQLSLLNISSASKIQRSSETPLQPETIQTLKEAQIAVEAGVFLPPYTAKADAIVRSTDKELDVLSKECGEVTILRSPEEVISSPVSAKPLEPKEGAIPLATMAHSVGFEANISANFIMLPIQSEDISPFQTGNVEPKSSTAVPAAISAIKARKHEVSSGKTFRTPTSKQVFTKSVKIEPLAETTRRLKSSSSSESFKSALSEQDASDDIEFQVKEVQSVMHAFQIALEALDSLVSKRFPQQDINAFPAVKCLKASLKEGAEEVERRHKYYFKCHGHHYLRCFTGSHSSGLEDLSSLLMKDVVTALRMYSADHSEIYHTSFDTLIRWSDRCRRRALNLLDSAELLVQPELHVTHYRVQEDSTPCEVPGCNEICSGSIDFARHYSRIHAIHTSSRSNFTRGRPISSFAYPDNRRLRRPESRREDSQSSLAPTVGYTFKRFEDNYARALLPNSDIVPSPTNSKSNAVNLSSIKDVRNTDSKDRTPPMTSGIHELETEKLPDTSSTTTVRASRPKVKTGCIECARRRVKCDQGKPRCKKCLQTGRDCTGYRNEMATRDPAYFGVVNPMVRSPLRFAGPSDESYVPNRGFGLRSSRPEHYEQTTAIGYNPLSFSPPNMQHATTPPPTTPQAHYVKDRATAAPARSLSARFDPTHHTTSAFRSNDTQRQATSDAYEYGYHENSYAFRVSHGVPDRRFREEEDSDESDHLPMRPPPPVNLRGPMLPHLTGTNPDNSPSKRISQSRIDGKSHRGVQRYRVTPMPAEQPLLFHMTHMSEVRRNFPREDLQDRRWDTSDAPSQSGNHQRNDKTPSDIDPDFGFQRSLSLPRPHSHHEDHATEVEDTNSCIHTGGDYELERYQRETEYYEQPSPPPSPIIIRQRASEPQQIAIQPNEEKRPILEDMRLVPPASGIGLRRTTRTTYRTGSLRKPERIPFTKRVGSRTVDQTPASGSESSYDVVRWRAKRAERSRSRSPQREKIKTGLELAAAVKYVQTRKANNEELGGGRIRTRSRRRHNSVGFYDSSSSDWTENRSRHKSTSIAKAGAATAAVAGVVEQSQGKSHNRERSRSKSRIRAGVPFVTLGSAGAAVADLYENRRREPRTEEDEFYYRREVNSRDVASDRNSSDEEDYLIRKFVRNRSRSRSNNTHYRRHLAEGALAGAGAAALLASHRAKTKNATEHRCRNVVGGAALGAIEAEVITRARSRYRERGEHRSRSKSSSMHSNPKTRRHSAGEILPASQLSKEQEMRDHQGPSAVLETFERGVSMKPRSRSLSPRPKTWTDDSEGLSKRVFQAVPGATGAIPLLSPRRPGSSWYFALDDGVRVEIANNGRRRQSYYRSSKSARPSGYEEKTRLALSYQEEINDVSMPLTADIPRKQQWPRAANLHPPMMCNIDPSPSPPSMVLLPGESSDFSLNPSGRKTLRPSYRPSLGDAILAHFTDNGKQLNISREDDGESLASDDEEEITKFVSPLTNPLSSTLWQVALQILHDTDAETFESLMFELAAGLCLGTSSPKSNFDDGFVKDLSERVRKLSGDFGQVNTNWNDIIAISDNIVKIFLTVDEQLGLQIAAIGWGCVYVLLSIYQRIISLPYSEVSRETIRRITTALTQLQDVVAIIARYAVMENLYKQSRGSLSLKPEYKSSLVSLCTTILKYFEAAFALARNTTKLDEGKDAEDTASETRTNTRLDNYTRCGDLLETIKAKNQSCQGFRVMVEPKAQSEDESESSDESWEELQGPDLAIDIGVDRI